jgi:3-oxoacyl-[acyl-carrier-protein] synthase-3
MAKVARQALDAAGIGPQDLDAFIPHQANERIIDSMTRSMGLPSRVTVAKDIVTSGNTSGASIPMAMEAVLASGGAPSGGTALLLGYGAGLSYAAMAATLP